MPATVAECREGRLLLLAMALLAAACQGYVTSVGDRLSGSPSIDLSARSLSFATAVPGQDPPSQLVTVTVSRTGPATTASPTVAVTYLEGSAWLSAAVEGAASPYALHVQVVTAGLSPGTYRATVSVAIDGIPGSPQALLVALTVGPAGPPTLVVTPSMLAFAGVAGAAGPVPQALVVTSAGGGTLVAPTASVGYATGAGWLSAAVSGTSAPFEVTVTATPGGLAPGTYQATVFVASTGAASSPAAIPVTFTVSPPPPVIAVSPTSLSFVATQGGASPAPRSLAVTSASPGSLARPSATVTYATGADWLLTSVGGTSAPFTVTVAPATGSLAAGTYTATISIASAGATNDPVEVPVALAVTPTPAAGTISAASLTRQAAQAGHLVADPPAVLVLDARGQPVAGAAVEFQVVAGGGTVAGPSATSDPGGVARATSWTLGAAGPQQVLALAPAYSGSPVTFDADVKAGAYEVSLRFVNPPTMPQGLAFQRARERIEQLVVGDVADLPISRTAAEMAGCGGLAISETVDDLLVVVALEPIDGPGQVLGAAGPCLVRAGSRIPVVGLMRFDTADLAQLEAGGRLEAVVLHEMLHVLGFGSLWPGAGLVSGAGGPDPYFTGASALDAFLAYNGGALYPGARVPVEGTGGLGTRDSHWRETVLENELMTGWLSGTTQPLSRTTAGSLADLGYAVDPTASDPFHLATAGLRLGGGPPDVALGDDVLRVPLQVVEADGTVR
jgi:hypothetical protein